MKLVVTKNMDELSRKAADWIVVYIIEILKKKSYFTFVLSGGTTPKQLYQLLASPGYHEKIDWHKIHFFWGDERYVPFSDKRNNAKMAFDYFLSQVDVLKENIHSIQTDITPGASAAGYESLLHQFFPDPDHTFDLVLLGIGNNAHTLSLFPGYDVIKEKEKWVQSFYLKEQEMYRITLTAPVINAANRIAFLVSGSEKAASLYHILSEEYDPDLYPAQLIQPYNGEAYWWVDEAAAADLER